MITEIMTKEVFLEFIDKLIGKNEVVIFTNRLENIKVNLSGRDVYDSYGNKIDCYTTNKDGIVIIKSQKQDKTK